MGSSNIEEPLVSEVALGMSIGAVELLDSAGA
jgi:hypothetical protein